MIYLFRFEEDSTPGTCIGDIILFFHCGKLCFLVNRERIELRFSLLHNVNSLDEQRTQS